MSHPAAQKALEAWQAGRVDECLTILRGMDAGADDPLALQIWALAAAKNGSRVDALALLARAARIAPDDAQAQFNLAVSLQAIDDMPAAISHYFHTLRLQPHHQGALNNLSDLLRRRGRAAEGWDMLQRYRAAGGDMTGLEIRAAKLAMDERRFGDAAVWFKKAEAHAPGNASVQWEHAMLSLVREDFRAGWPQYERRLDSYGLDRLGIYPYQAPMWRGEPIAGKRLLLHREQGLGDTLMFARTFQGLIDDGAELHLAVHPPLARLLKLSFPAAKVWSSVTTVGTGRQPEQRWLKVAPPMDFQAPICSLGALRLADGVPPTPAYLTVDPADVARWAERLSALAPGSGKTRRAGLVIGTRQVRWSDDGLTNAVRKTVTSAAISALADVPNTTWIALHDAETAPLIADVPRLPIIDPSPWITDLADTAALIANLDIVVSADTAVAHLAAAMGKPVLLMAWWNADWRWGVNRTDSYWYPDVRVFRQASAGDWDSVTQAVAKALS